MIGFQGKQDQIKRSVLKGFRQTAGCEGGNSPGGLIFQGEIQALFLEDRHISRAFQENHSMPLESQAAAQVSTNRSSAEAQDG
jgi:hypothetical protein